MIHQDNPAGAGKLHRVIIFIIAVVLATLGMNLLGSPLEAAVSKPAIDKKIKQRLKTKVYRRIVTDREVISYATLKETGEGENKVYQFYTSMLVNAGVSRTHRILTSYETLKQVVPFIEKASFDPTRRILKMSGGIWGYKMQSWVKFTDRSVNWVQFEIVRGHFRGLKGNIFFERLKNRGTLVYFGGKLKGKSWPLAFIIERGAEVVFRIAGRNMRNQVESPVFGMQNVAAHNGNSNEEAEEIPQPRSHL